MLREFDNMVKLRDQKKIEQLEGELKQLGNELGDIAAGKEASVKPDVTAGQPASAQPIQTPGKELGFKRMTYALLLGIGVIALVASFVFDLEIKIQILSAVTIIFGLVMWYIRSYYGKQLRADLEQFKRRFLLVSTGAWAVKGATDKKSAIDMTISEYSQKGKKISNTYWNYQYALEIIYAIAIILGWLLL